ncbi:GNAT family N-acetyltransferase [Chelatococcus sambhunathii]|uniref:GNAT family N-acetyltransferase n=1 Tax=Chelatococcus sambhunathii TaxID=363953 RepID=A0ABU1DFC3_9HYPH|nr:GNAT family N-acetyltransferase [Chelatococcus sambhunathii]
MHVDLSVDSIGEADKTGLVSRLLARLRALKADSSDTAVAQKMAGSAFLIRVVNAGIAFASQILLARWMGQTEYGVYVYVWTWVLLLGGLTSFGLASAPQRFIPQYAESGDDGRLRGFLLGSRLMAVAMATAIAAAGLLVIWLFSAHLQSWTVVPLYLAMFCVPMYVLTDVQDGIARTNNWIDVALAPAYFIRPLLILGLLAMLGLTNFSPTAPTAMAASLIATWATAVIQLLFLQRRLSRKVAPGPRAYEAKTWMTVSFPIFLVEGFYLSLAYADVLILTAFRPPHDVAIYYACVKVMSLVAFISFSVSAAVAHRFTEYAVAGERERLDAMVRDAARWTFWPSLAGCAGLLAMGWPMLWLFGGDFTDGYYLLFVIALGLLCRATIGPLERLLNMLGQQNVCAAIYGCAFALNITLCFALIPSWGMLGAAVATSVTQVFESVALFLVTRQRLGLGGLPWGRRQDHQALYPLTSTGDALTDAMALPFAPVLDLPVPGEARKPYHFELLSIEALAARRAEWEQLAERAIKRNLFAEADFAAAARHLRYGRDVRLATVWDMTGAEPRLICVAPVIERRMLPLLPGLSSALWGYFGALGTPMIDAERSELAARGLMLGLEGSGRALFLFRFLPENDAVMAALRKAVAETGHCMARVDGHSRAMLRGGGDAESFLAASVSSKKLKEYRRQLRRLGDEAPVSFRESRTPEEVSAALDRFLELEARGWKGRGGSAMRGHPEQLGFVRDLFARRAEKGEARIIELFAGEETVAAGLVLQAGRQAWFYKIAYDERRARWSPGVQLTLELTRRLLEDDTIDEVDSTAIADHPMINHIWRDRLELADHIVALRAPAGRLLGLAVQGERLRRSARIRIRAIYARLTERP